MALYEAFHKTEVSEGKGLTISAGATKRLILKQSAFISQLVECRTGSNLLNLGLVRIPLKPQKFFWAFFATVLV